MSHPANFMEAPKGKKAMKKMSKKMSRKSGRK